MQEFEEKIGLLKNEKIDFQNKISEKDDMVDQIKTENMLMIKQMEDQINILNIDNSSLEAINNEINNKIKILEFNSINEKEIINFNDMQLSYDKKLNLNYKLSQ